MSDSERTSEKVSPPGPVAGLPPEPVLLEVAKLMAEVSELVQP